MALATVPGTEAVPVAGACLISGVYDLEPVRLSYVNDQVRMNAATAAANSPLHHLPLVTPRLIVAQGLVETNEYGRQHATFVGALQAGGQPVVDLVVAGTNHFDLPLTLGDPATPLGSAVLRQMGRL
jgi:arylformamidase